MVAYWQASGVILTVYEQSTGGGRYTVRRLPVGWQNTGRGLTVGKPTVNRPGITRGRLRVMTATVAIAMAAANIINIVIIVILKINASYYMQKNVTDRPSSYIVGAGVYSPTASNILPVCQ